MLGTCIIQIILFTAAMPIARLVQLFGTELRSEGLLRAFGSAQEEVTAPPESKPPDLKASTMGKQQSWSHRAAASGPAPGAG